MSRDSIEPVNPVEVKVVRAEDLAHFLELKLRDMEKRRETGAASDYGPLTDEIDGVSEDEMKRRLRQQGTWLVYAEQNKKLKGMAAAKFYPKSGIAFVYNVFTDESIRNQGIARELMEKLLAEIVKNVSVSVVHLGDVRNPTSVGLYERMGFQKAAPTGIGLFDGKGSEAHPMSKTIR
ncbi:MAG TPA: GNAT family N-acetyltransferase [Candidatus Paceibacterota bacterium]